VIGRPILYKTTKEFLLRFGLKDIGELPSMEEFEKLVAESFQSELLPVEVTEAASATSAAAQAENAASKSVETLPSEPAHEVAVSEPSAAGEDNSAA
jgi:segregation and condensation protein B